MATDSTRSLKRDLQQDFRRYCQYFNYPGDVSFWNKLMVFSKSPAYWAIINHRFGHWANHRFPNKMHPAGLASKCLYSMGKFLSVVLVKIEILSALEAGPGLFLSNKGNIIIGAQRMGEGCTIHHHVTVGMKAGGQAEGLPVLENHVWVGWNTVVYGEIVLGPGAIVGSNTILSRNLPPGVWVGGNPCRLIQKQLPPGPRHVDLKELQCDAN